MSEHLYIQGTLAETTVPDLFRSLIRSGETAIVSLEAIGRHDNIYFREGKIVFASTSDSDLGLAEVLLRTGDLNLQQYSEALEQMATTKRIGALLCELGYLKPDELTRALERQAATIVEHGLAFRSGNYTIEFNEELPADIPILHLNTERLMLDGVGRIEFWSLISRGVGSMTRMLRQAEDADARVYHLDLNDEESHVYGLLQEPLTLQTLCDRSYLPNFTACRTVWALLSIHLLDDAEAGEMDQQRAAVESEYELEHEVEKYNATFQRIFHLVFQQIGDHTYDFVDRVVVQLSSTVLPYLSGINLLNEGRVDFDQLLNNLISSGSADHRQIVQDVLNELLYGWILEIRTEFGSKLEPQMNEILQGLKR